MKRRQALTQARQTLAEGYIEDASLEGEILLRHVLDIDRAQLFADLDVDVKPSQVEELMQLVERRSGGEPSAYITGHKEFYGLEFKVDPRVLIPRPETEMLVEKAIALCRARPVSTVADIGTGCGNIAISLAVNIPSVKIYAIDISTAALETAAENIAKYGLRDRIIPLPGNLLEPLPETVDIIVANLPYVKKAEITSKFEPEIALDGGEEGLDKIKDLCSQARSKLRNKGSLILEMGQGQAEAILTDLHKTFPGAEIFIFKDLAGIERVVGVRLT